MVCALQQVLSEAGLVQGTCNPDLRIPDSPLGPLPVSPLGPVYCGNVCAAVFSVRLAAQTWRVPAVFIWALVSTDRAHLLNERNRPQNTLGSYQLGAASPLDHYLKSRVHTPHRPSASPRLPSAGCQNCRVPPPSASPVSGGSLPLSSIIHLGPQRSAATL